VAAEFIVEAERAVHYAVVREDDCVFERATANEAHGAKGLDFALETKSARTRQEAAKTLLAHSHFNFLLSN